MQHIKVKAVKQQVGHAGCSNDELLLLSVRGTEGEKAESLHGQVGGNSSRKNTWNP